MVFIAPGPSKLGLSGNGPAASGVGMLARGTLIALVITAPSLATFGAAWLVSGDLLASAVAGGLVHFAAIGFSQKISRRLLGRGG